MLSLPVLHFAEWLDLNPSAELEVELLVEVVVGLYVETIEDREHASHLSPFCVLAVPVGCRNAAVD